MRPVSFNSRLISLSEVPASKSRYYCIVAHNNITDPLEVKYWPEARLMVLHCSVEGRLGLDEHIDLVFGKKQVRCVGIVVGGIICEGSLRGLLLRMVRL